MVSRDDEETGRRRAIAAIAVGGLLALVSAGPAAALPSPDCTATTSAELTSKLSTIACLTITLSPGSYAADPGPSFPAFTPNHDVTIHGAGAATTSLARSSGTGPIFSVGTFSVSVDNVTIRDATGSTGVILPSTTGAVTLDHVVIDNNSGGIFSASNSPSAVTVTDSVISNNSSAEGGGVFAQGTGTLNFNRVLFSGNSSTAEADGGGAFSVGNALTAHFTNVTFSGNHAKGNGGAMLINFAGATAELNNVTMSGNTANDDHAVGLGKGEGGGLARLNGTVLLRNSVIAGNIDGDPTTSNEPDCHDPVSGITNQGNNMIGDPEFTCVLTTPPAILTGNAMLNPLSANGGPTMTMSLQPTSPLLNTGNPGTPDGTGVRCAAVDQRGQPRGGAAGLCDIGAYESQPVVLSPIGDQSVTAGQNLSFTVSAADPDLLDTLTFMASSLPPGSTFNPGTRTFSWTPTAADVGAHPGVHFSVGDGIFSDAEDIGITVAAVPVTSSPGTSSPGTSSPPGTTSPTAPSVAHTKKCKKKRRAAAVTAKKCKKKRK